MFRKIVSFSKVCVWTLTLAGTQAMSEQTHDRKMQSAEKYNVSYGGKTGSSSQQRKSEGLREQTIQSQSSNTRDAPNSDASQRNKSASQTNSSTSHQYSAHYTGGEPSQNKRPQEMSALDRLKYIQNNFRQHWSGINCEISGRPGNLISINL